MATPVIFLSFTPRCGGCVTGRPLSICWLIIHNTFQFIPRIVEMERKTRAVYFRQWRTRRAYLRIKIQPASLFARVPSAKDTSGLPSFQSHGMAFFRHVHRCEMMACSVEPEHLFEATASCFPLNWQCC